MVLHENFTTNLVKNPATLILLLTSDMVLSQLTEAEQHSFPIGTEILARLATGSDNWMEAPDGIITVSVFDGSVDGVGVGAKAIDGGRDGVVGTTCCDAIASCSRHFTSSADARSTGA